MPTFPDRLSGSNCLPFVKEYLPELIDEYGTTNVGKTVSSEMREVDVFFTPEKSVPTSSDTLGLLGKIAQTPCLFEVFRKSVEIHQVKECLGKLFDIQGLQRREQRKNQEKLSEGEIPHLWIINPTLSRKKLEALGAKSNPDNWGEGVYFLADAFNTGIIVIHQLPVNRDTLWLRILGRGKVQQNAIEELNNLPSNYDHRHNVIELVCNLFAMLELNQQEGNLLTREDRELIMNLSPVYLEKLAENKQQGIQEGLEIERKNMIESILRNRFGEIDEDLSSIIPQLLKLSPMEIVPLLLNLSRTDLINRFREN